MIFDAGLLGPDNFYKVMLQAIIPRPIAWVLSKNSNGTFNVAPFSFFNGVASEPPLLMIAVGMKDEQTRKDTWVNAAERPEFVVHIPPAEMAEAMVATSKSLPHDESEIDFAKLETVPVEGESLPRLKGPRVAMFCRTHQIIEVGTERIGLILGEIKKIWADDEIVRIEGTRTLLDPKKIDPVARLGGLGYSLLGDIKNVARPK